MNKEMRTKKSLLMMAAGLAICLVAMFAMAGCGSQSEEAAPPEETTVAEETTAAPEETTAAPEETTAVEETAAQKEIGEKKALKIARKDAGVSKSDIAYSNAHLDMDDGRTVYEVEFQAGEIEYSYDIDAYTGEILDRDQDSIYDD